MSTPWEKWIPGVLNRGQIGQLCEEGLITVEVPFERVIDESAIDLSLSDEAYKMIAGSAKPSSTAHYDSFIKRERLAKKLPKANDGTFTLESKGTYVFKLRERLDGQQLSKAGVYGQATAKSSIGRVDVLARLIVDGMDTYESFNPDGLARGDGNMFLEITPITFSVKVREGIGLSQLRLSYGNFKESEVKSDQMFKTILQGPGANDGSLRVDLSDDQVGGLPVAAFCAITPSDPNDAIPLWEEKEGYKPEPWKYWKFVGTDRTKRLKIEQNKFYILKSKEKVSVPEGIAIYCKASDETIGEMRIHYAGFVHPLFGLRRADNKRGTPLIFEVRGHQVDVSLADGERLANLEFYRMSKDSSQTLRCPYDERNRERPELCDACLDCPAKIEEQTISPYEEQSLKLSKFFGDWPAKLKSKDDGTVEPI